MLPYPLRVQLVETVPLTQLFTLASVCKEFRDMCRWRWKPLDRRKKDDVLNLYYHHGRGRAELFATRGWTDCLLQPRVVTEINDAVYRKRVYLVVEAAKKNYTDTVESLLSLPGYRENTLVEDLCVILACHGCVSIVRRMLAGWTDERRLRSAFRVFIYANRTDLCDMLLEMYGDKARPRRIDREAPSFKDTTIAWLTRRFG